MPAGMKPLEKFLKKQTTALTRAGGFGDKAGGNGASRRRASLSRVVPFFRETSPESGPAREVFSPDSEEPPCWPPAAADFRSPSLSSDEQSSEGSLEAAWTPLPADTPEKLVLTLLDSVAGGRRQGSSAETLLDDFMLTHPIFLPADKLQQVLLEQFRADRKPSEGWQGWDGADRKQAVLSVAFRYLDTYRELLQEEGERSHCFPKELYLCAAQELSRYPELVEDVLKLQRWTEILQSQVSLHSLHTHKKNIMPVLRRRRGLCRAGGAYESMGGASTAEEQTLMRSNLHHADLQCCAVLCRPQVEFVCYVFHGEQARWRPLNLELVLQRCSEVQHWVATEILQCQSLPKRVQLLRKFIKIAALCKQQQDLLSFLALVLGLDNPAVSRLRLTWEPAPARPSSLWAEPEKAGDPSRNHKSYRDLLSSLRPPLIPFTPLLLK
uniref:Rap guanine nucleotide exchange factor like 1 n=1 Tax=Lepisosteus oculatus TaxID=7918 RepID=W5N7R8_LEPOC